MCKIDGGRFGFGDDRKPTQVRAFYIDQFEVSVAQAALFLNARGSNLCPGLDRRHRSVGPNTCVLGANVEGESLVLRDGTYQAVRGFERTTPPYFSWQGAMEYCAWVGKQVPSSAQWEYAASHDPRTGKDYRFPWGDSWRPNHASCWNPPDCDAPPAPELGSSTIGLFDGTKGRGDGSSPWGLHDTVGGTSELVFACDDPDATCKVDEPCACTAQEIPSDAPTTDELRLTRRIGHPDVGGQGRRSTGEIRARSRRLEGYGVGLRDGPRSLASSLPCILVQHLRPDETGAQLPPPGIRSNSTSICP